MQEWPRGIVRWCGSVAVRQKDIDVTAEHCLQGLALRRSVDELQRGYQTSKDAQTASQPAGGQRECFVMQRDAGIKLSNRAHLLLHPC